MATFHILNLGCKVNRIESDYMESIFFRAGLVPSALGDADAVVVNTCTVTGEAEKKARKAVRHAIRENRHAPIIVTGCASAISPEDFCAMDGRVSVVPKASVEEYIASLVASFSNEESVCASQTKNTDRTRKGIKVQDGCDNKCSYCIVRIARGPSRSYPAKELIDQAICLSDAGVKEIVLSGINIGAYRVGSYALEDLLKDLLEATSDVFDGIPPRFRLSSIEPQSITESLIDQVASSEGRICRHFHIPLQSGSSKVLCEMGRKYSVEDFSDLIGMIRKRIPKIALTTDVIVGFPGESEDDFAATCDLVRECAFSKIHVFPYSAREGTDAACRGDQIPPEVKTRRAKELRAISQRLGMSDLKRRAGDEEYFLVQEDGMMMSESYHEISAFEGVPTGALIQGRFPGLLIE